MHFRVKHVDGKQVGLKLSQLNLSLPLFQPIFFTNQEILTTSTVIQSNRIISKYFSDDNKLHIFLRFAYREPDNILNKEQDLPLRILGKISQI